MVTPNRRDEADVPDVYHKDMQYASPVKLQSFSNHFPSFCQSYSSTLSIETFEFPFVSRVCYRGRLAHRLLLAGILS